MANRQDGCNNVRQTREEQRDSSIAPLKDITASTLQWSQSKNACEAFCASSAQNVRPFAEVCWLRVPDDRWREHCPCMAIFRNPMRPTHQLCLEQDAYRGPACMQGLDRSIPPARHGPRVNLAQRVAARCGRDMSHDLQCMLKHDLCCPHDVQTRSRVQCQINGASNMKPAVSPFSVFKSHST